jgi:hypothetical protein
MSITISISSGLFTYFITLLIEVPTKIGGDLGGLDCSNRSKDTNNLDNLVRVMSILYNGAMFIS